MNKVYFFQESSGDFGGVYVAAENWKKARNLAIMDELIADHVWNPITDVEGSLCRKEGKPITTMLEGILSVKHIKEVGCAWWDCENCGSDNFEILNDMEYKCHECESINRIPYINC
jgi:DNA-directed RNA polymerase subunit RPC12/RpoP